MSLASILNPFSPAEEAAFQAKFSLKRPFQQHSQQQQQQQQQQEEEVVEEEEILSGSRHVPKRARLEFNSLNTPPLSEEDEDEEEEKGTSTSFSASFTDSEPISEGSSADDDEDDEEEEEGFSEISTPKNQAELYEIKMERITHKSEKVLKQLFSPPLLSSVFHSTLAPKVLMAIGQTLRRIPEHKMKKRTVNQTTIVVTFCALRSCRVNASLEQVIDALKDIERSHSISRSNKPQNGNKRKSEILSLSKMINSLGFSATTTNNLSIFNNTNSTDNISNAIQTPLVQQQQPSQPQPQTQHQTSHRQATEEATKELCRQLALKPELESRALALARFSEESTMASRHIGSVAAACVLTSSRALKGKLTLTRVSETVGVTCCTIRKALKALEVILEQQPSQ